MLHKPSPFDRASIVRHVALFASALIAYIAREKLHVGNSVLWFFAIAVLLNLQTALLSSHPRIGTLARSFSPIYGLVGWTTLVFLTGGVDSPFIAGLSLEIILAAMTISPFGIAMVTGGSVTGLWTQQVMLGLDQATLSLMVMTGFLMTMGGTTFYVARRWRWSEERHTQRQAEIHRRLELLEKDLNEARTIGKLGEHAAWLAHGLKNSVHSLRGFARLIEPRLCSSTRDLELLDGLCTAIDHLEELSRATLGPPGPRALCKHRTEQEQSPRIVRDVIAEIAVSYPQVCWSLSLGEILPSLQAPPVIVREVLGIVIRNAAEAMDGSGEIAVEAVVSGECTRFTVRDHGPGIREQDQREILRAGYTTKIHGHGFGLFLARRLVEDNCGTLSIAAVDGGGTLCTVELPRKNASRIANGHSVLSGR